MKHPVAIMVSSEYPIIKSNGKDPCDPSDLRILHSSPNKYESYSVSNKMYLQNKFPNIW